ncbi:MAG: hypothetical protein SF187_08360 [Deltaproteobacteria bacterium]|nr:hypothetical protein [Deltaproteobacteria bacterium]
MKSRIEDVATKARLLYSARWGRHDLELWDSREIGIVREPLASTLR